METILKPSFIELELFSGMRMYVNTTDIKRFHEDFHNDFHKGESTKCVKVLVGGDSSIYGGVWYEVRTTLQQFFKALS